MAKAVRSLGETVGSQEGAEQGHTESALHCLECGATLPADATRCPSCGNERSLLPSRWAPPGEDGERVVAGPVRFSGETRVLVGLTLALFCGLALLGAARISGSARLRSESDNNVQGTARNIPTVALDIEPMLPEPDVAPPLPVIEDVDGVRGRARLAEETGAWDEAALAWVEVIDHPDAGLGDFLALASALELSDDIAAARTALNRACVRFPDSPQGYIALGNLNEQTGDLNAARFQYLMGLSYCPEDATLSEGLSRCEDALGIERELPPLGELTVEGRPLPQPPQEAVQVDARPPVTGGGVVPPAPASQTESSQPQSTPSVEQEPMPDPGVPVTLIGSESDVAGEESESQAEGTEVAPDEVADGDSGQRIEITGLQIGAAPDRVSIELSTTGPAELISRSATQPSRLILRLPQVRIADGAAIAPSLLLNVPLVDRVTILQASDDSMVILVVYLGPDARYTVAADSGKVRVIVSPPPTQEPTAGEDEEGSESA